VASTLIADGWSIERDSRVPPYAQIERRLAALIEAGALHAGDRVPSERELARQVGVSRLTARAALAALARRGLVERGVGRRGTFVARARLTYDLREFAGFTEMARRQGLEASARILTAGEHAAPEPVAGELALESGSPAYAIVRLRAAGGEPMMLEETWIPAEPFPGLLDQDLSRSLYAVMHEAYGRAPVRATERLHATVAGAREARALGVRAGAPLMLVVRVAYAQDGTPVEFAHDYHRGDRARFVAELTTRVG
jgi:GntR family transcriptional regulator